MKRLLALAIPLLLGVAACGGDDADSDADGADEPTTTADAGSDDVAPPTPDDADDGADDGGDDGGVAGGDDGGDAEGSGPSTATVTLGDQTYNFSTEGAIVAQCQTDMFGVFSAQLPMADGGDGSIQVVILRDGTDPEEIGAVNAVEVSVDDEDWVAHEADELFTMSEELEPGMSQVDSVEFDGSTVRGTATFVRQLSVIMGEIETATGSFEATCGEERIS